MTMGNASRPELKPERGEAYQSYLTGQTIFAKFIKLNSMGT